MKNKLEEIAPWSFAFAWCNFLVFPFSLQTSHSPFISMLTVALQLCGIPLQVTHRINFVLTALLAALKDFVVFLFSSVVFHHVVEYGIHSGLLRQALDSFELYWGMYRKYNCILLSVLSAECYCMQHCIQQHWAETNFRFREASALYGLGKCLTDWTAVVTYCRVPYQGVVRLIDVSSYGTVDCVRDI